MKKEKNYHFRANKNLLKNIDRGNRSKFIREAVTLRINIDDTAYQKLQANNYELINQYKTIIKECNQDIKTMQNEITRLKNFKKRIKIQLDKQYEEVEELQQRINTKKALIKDNNIEKHRKEAANTLLKNIIIRKANPLADIADIDYLMTHAGFYSKKEFKIYVQEYLQENIKTGDILGKTLIKQEDIEYLKNQINKRI